MEPSESSEEEHAQQEPFPTSQEIEEEVFEVDILAMLVLFVHHSLLYLIDYTFIDYTGKILCLICVISTTERVFSTTDYSDRTDLTDWTDLTDSVLWEKE